MGKKSFEDVMDFNFRDKYLLDKVFFGSFLNFLIFFKVVVMFFRVLNKLLRLSVKSIRKNMID